MRTKFPLAIVAWMLAASAANGQIPRYGLSTRVELHMLPAVTSGPLDPSWHPDGSALAYSMRGDIWIQRIGTDHAQAITQGPGYHFEPAWSPDGEWLALVVDTDGQLDIAVVRSDGSEFRRLTSDFLGRRSTRVDSRREIHRVRLCPGKGFRHRPVRNGDGGY